MNAEHIYKPLDNIQNHICIHVKKYVKVVDMDFNSNQWGEVGDSSQ